MGGVGEEEGDTHGVLERIRRKRRIVKTLRMARRRPGKSNVVGRLRSEHQGTESH